MGEFPYSVVSEAWFVADPGIIFPNVCCDEWSGRPAVPASASGTHRTTTLALRVSVMFRAP